MNTPRTWMNTVALLALGLIAAMPAMAANVLQDVRYAAAPGGKVDITLQFAEPVGEVQAFTTDSPPRIAIDLPGTINGLSARRVAVGSGATSAVSAAEAGGRTRVVVDLLRPAGYTTRSSGNLLVVTVDAGTVGGASAAMAAGSDPTKRSASTVSVSNIDFRRGENGAGRVILKFDGDSANADMRNEGNRIVVDVSNAQIPEKLRRKLDVADFATPVSSLEPNTNAGGTRLVINTAGTNDTMAYQTGNEYIIEVTPKRTVQMAANKSTQSRSASGAVSSTSAQRYSGKSVTFNFQDIPVRTVLQLIAEESNLNIVASDSVSGNLTLRLVNVPWDQALDIVLRAKSLDKRRDGNVVWVGPQAELASYEQAREDARIAIETRAETITEYIAINYGKAEDIAKLLTEDAKSGGGGGGGGGGAGGASQQQRGILSSRGSVSFDNRTNTLLLVDIPKKVQEVKELLLIIDRPVDQVLIEARIVIADESFARELGSKFSVTGQPTSPTNTVDGFADTVAFGLSGAPKLGFSILSGSHSINLELSALESTGRGEIISNPRVITSNQQEAIIRQGQEIGYTTSTPSASADPGGATPGGSGVNAPSTVAFKDVLMELKVTPTITQDGRVFLSIALKKDDISGFTDTSAGRIPQIAKREINTAVLVENGQTVVVGGVYEIRSTDDISKVPFLGDIPFLGNFFKKKGKSKGKAELLIFITPTVLMTSRAQPQVSTPREYRN